MGGDYGREVIEERKGMEGTGGEESIPSVHPLSFKILKHATDDHLPDASFWLQSVCLKIAYFKTIELFDYADSQEKCRLMIFD